MKKMMNAVSVLVVNLLILLQLTACASNRTSTEKRMAPGSSEYVLPTFTMADVSYGRPAVMVTKADVDMYAGAPEKEKDQIRTVNALLDAGQYEKAFTAPLDGEYGLARKVQIAQQFFDYRLLTWNPEAAVLSALAENPDSGILHMALAWYYADGRMRYGDQWIKTPAELALLSVTHYQLAEQAGLTLDAYQLSLWAESYMELNDVEHAIPLLEKSLSMYDSVDVHYNLGMCYGYTAGDTIEQGLAEFIYAAQCYEYIPYKIDALLYAGDFALGTEEIELAKACIGVAYSLDPENPEVLYRNMDLYLLLDDTDAAVHYAASYYGLFYQYLACLDDIAKEFANYGQFDQYNLFLDTALARLSDNMEACGHLHYFYAVYWYNMDNSTKAKAELLRSRDYYKKAGMYEGEVKDAIEGLIANM